MTQDIELKDIQALPRYHGETITTEYLDIMGHMNVRWYIALFSRAVTGLFQEIGMTEEYFAPGKAGSFALRQFINYLAEVRVGEEVSIHTRLIDRSDKKIHLVHFMVNESRQVLSATMEALISHADLVLRKTSPFPPEIAQRIEALVEDSRSLPWSPPLCGAIKA
jgi:acyl-CoA thioester hydrolase